MQDVRTRGLEKTIAFSTETVVFVKALPLNRSTNSLPPPRENVETKRSRFRPPLLPLSQTLHTSVSVLGKVEGGKAVQPKTTPAAKKKKCSDSPKPSASKKKPSTSSRPSSHQNLDDKWAERFSRLEAMLLAKSFTIPVEPVVKPAAEVTTSQKPFFDPGATTSSLARPASVTGPSLV